MEQVIAQLKALGKERTPETYAATLRSFRRFRQGRDLMFHEMDSDMMQAYESYLRSNGVRPNTTSFYMRILRAVYNRAVEKDLTVQRHPFRHVYTGVDKTVKRAVPLQTVRRIREMDLSDSSTLAFARDVFLFSFYTRGMSFIDIAYLEKRNLRNGILTYRRKKTNQTLSIRWEPSMQAILNCYAAPATSPFLFNIISDLNKPLRHQYQLKQCNVNRSLKLLGISIGLQQPLTMYCARHSWASIAYSEGILTLGEDSFCILR